MDICVYFVKGVNIYRGSMTSLSIAVSVVFHLVEAYGVDCQEGVYGENVNEAASDYGVGTEGTEEGVHGVDAGMAGTISFANE